MRSPAPIDTSHALYVADGNGDGLVIEGELGDITRWVDQLHTHVHQATTDDAGQGQTR